MCRKKCANPEEFLFSPEHFEVIIIKEREENDYNYNEYARQENEIVEKIENGGVIDEKYLFRFIDSLYPIFDDSWGSLDLAEPSIEDYYSIRETASPYKDIIPSVKDTITRPSTTSNGRRFLRAQECYRYPQCYSYVKNLYKAHNLITNKLKNIANRFFGTLDNLINCNINRLQYRKFYMEECRQFPSRVYDALMTYFDTRFNQKNWCNSRLYH